MRTVGWIAALVLGAGLAASAPAQTLSFGGNRTTVFVNRATAIPDVARPIALPQLRQNTSFSLTDLIPKVLLPSPQSTFARSTFPTPAQMPGKEYLKAFGFQVPKPIK